MRAEATGMFRCRPGGLDDLSLARDRTWVPGLRHRHLGLRLAVEDDAEDVAAGHAVDHRVVGLAHHRPAALVQPLDEPDLPQRTVAVEPGRHEPATSRLAAARCRGRQRSVTDVVGEVEVRVVDPDRAAQVEGACRTTCRYRGTWGGSDSMSAQTSSYEGAGPSKICTPPMCMGWTSRSTWRNDASSGSGGPSAASGRAGIDSPATVSPAVGRPPCGSKGEMQAGGQHGWLR